jgi:hypothetical protein
MASANSLEGKRFSGKIINVEGRDINQPRYKYLIIKKPHRLWPWKKDNSGEYVQKYGITNIEKRNYVLFKMW